MIQHEKYMKIALEEARQSLSAGDFPVGCVLVFRDKIIASGRRVNSFGRVNEMDHAEMVALRGLLDSEQRFNVGEVTLYSTMEPCLMCYATLLVNGVHKIVYSYEDAMGGGTNLPLTALSPLYRDLKVEVTAGIMREDGLGLFKDFFANPENDYLRDSLLATYTLNQ